jgi:molybdopterin synthase catalytic subunit
MGNVRDHSEFGNVSKLYYETYTAMAKNKMAEIEKEVLAKWNIRKFVAIHRTGNLKVGETSVIVGVSSEHRKEAFTACKYAIDSIKSRVPIWKKEISQRGHKWVEGVSLVK